MDDWEIAARSAAQQTMAAYNHAGDRGRLVDLAATFTADGQLQIGSEPPIEGPEAIVERLSSAIRPDPVPRFVHHHVSGFYVRVASRESLEVASYFQVLTDAGLDHWGRYADTLVPAEGRWLFRRRRISADGFASTSCFRR